MIIEPFAYNSSLGLVEINDESVLLIREFAELLNEERNKCKEDPTGKNKLRAFRELTYIFLALSWKSPYADYNEQDRHQACLLDAKLTETEFNNPEFRAACRKYRQLQDANRSIRMLQAAQNTVDKFIDYFNNVDPDERDPQTGKPIFKVKDLITEISNLSKVHEELKVLESMVKQDLQQVSTIRGGAIEGYEPD